ncbi:Coronin-like protein crn1 [Dimargaris verticillata]|uniref:Coronin n=1 Tax=Dimargaris verticillata TaxID=2761393 RepID=A0A9W8B7Q0_9FUNG|nr:Coronin-like protein crn1 [Dimargaris verticillata]
MSRFVRPSKFRHVFGTPTKRDHCYDSLRVTNSAWDTNLVKVNPRYLAVNWSAGGGGAFAVLPLENTGPVLDTDFSPFNDSVIASASEDTRAMVWVIPEDLADLEESIDKPAVVLKGHGRKVGHVLFNPVAENVLATSSADLTVRLWDIEKGVQHQQLTGHKDNIQSMTWNWNGTLLATHSRDKKLRIFDARANQVVQETSGHQGIKGARITWLGDTPRLASTGFSRSSERQLYIWDTADLSKPLREVSIDLSSGILMPFYDPDTKMLYLAGKGDGNIRYFEFENDEMYYLAEYKSGEPQRGMASMPKRGLSTSDCEVMRFYKLTASMVEPVSFTVPRRSDAFQADIYPPALGDEPALTADQYFAGETADPVLLTFDEGYQFMPKLKDFSPQYAQVGVTPKSTTRVAPQAASPKPKPQVVTTSTPQPTPQKSEPSPPAVFSSPSPSPCPRPAEATKSIKEPNPVSVAPAQQVAEVSQQLEDELKSLQKDHAQLKEAYASQQDLIAAMAERLKALEVSQHELTKLTQTGQPEPAPVDTASRADKASSQSPKEPEEPKSDRGSGDDGE